MSYPCWNHIYGCKNEVAAPYDLCGPCFDEEDGRTTLESWEQEGGFHHICQHGVNIERCVRCNPFEA